MASGSVHGAVQIIDQTSAPLPTAAQPLPRPLPLPRVEPAPVPTPTPAPATVPAAAAPATLAEGKYLAQLFTTAQPTPPTPVPQAAPTPEPVPSPQVVPTPQPAPTPEPVAPAWQPELARQYEPTPPYEPAPQTAPATIATADDEDENEDDIFAAPVTPSGNLRVQRTSDGTAGGEVIFVFAGKGGVGKSTTTLMLATTAAEAGKRVIVIDANPGQADVQINMRLKVGAVPTIWDAVRSRDPATAIVTPGIYNAHRPRLAPLSFAVVLGPPAEHASPEHVSAEAYAAVLDYARTQADLVIVDTQTDEAHKTALFERFVIPTMVSGAWTVAIVNDSRAGVDNLLSRLGELARRGVTNARTLVLASMYETFDERTQQGITRKYGQFGTFVGSAGLDSAVRAQMNVGVLLHDSPSIAPAINAILSRVTGDPVFDVRPVEIAKRPWNPFRRVHR
nr:AAA family ATPase [Rathayibacter iranicus]